MLESNFSNNVSAPIPVRFVSGHCQSFKATALDVPDSLQPGDTVAPTFQITNLGTANTDPQGPVAGSPCGIHVTRFQPGQLDCGALYTALGHSEASPTPRCRIAHVIMPGSGHTIYNNNVTPGANVVTYTGAAVTLPTSPSTYYLGVVVDPYNTLKQLSLPANRLELIHTVGPATSGVATAGVVSTPLSPVPQFPNTPDGSTIGLVNTSVY